MISSVSQNCGRVTKIWLRVSQHQIMDQMIYYLTEHCLVYNIIYGNGFECAEIFYTGIHFSNAKISEAHLLYASIETGSFPWNKMIGQWEDMPKILADILCNISDIIVILFSIFLCGEILYTLYIHIVWNYEVRSMKDIFFKMVL